MKNYLKILILNIILGLVSINCNKSKDNSCDDIGNGIEVETNDFFELNTKEAWLQNIDKTKDKVNLIIDNQDEYEKYVGIKAGVERPVIDFNKNVLILGRVIHNSCGFVENQRVIENCNKYYYIVKLTNGLCGAVVEVNYFAIVSNKSSEVIFNVSY